MARSKSSNQWLKNHFDDFYVKLAQQQGYRSRAVYKLLEINERDKIFRPGMTVIDLGAAPGGWSQLAQKLIGNKGRIIAIDILPMEPLAGVQILQRDFREEIVVQELLTLLGEEKADLVISDIAPNISGMNSIDQPRAMYLVELAFDMAHKVLRREGDFLVKVFQGEGFDEFLREIKKFFRKVIIRKPKASRPQSREVYVLARSYSL